jgi:hypothetical protein
LPATLRSSKSRRTEFKLLDRELARKLEDGETYMLITDVSVRDLE